MLVHVLYTCVDPDNFPRGLGVGGKILFSRKPIFRNLNL